ncbi:MAG: Holliday junction branch migration protein RuvA [Bdellovibrionales bacterium]|nr:Holliday junction branch migration protein RuvA [Bdellovibrionales bacterium]
MIGYLHGEVMEVNTDHVILNVNGVGYEVLCTLDTLSRMMLGEMISFYTYTHVREDVLQLFGFLQTEEKQFFLSLLKVNGVGPKMAIAMMSGAPALTIMEFIENEDVKALSKLPKVGKKKAEQMVLTLKGKLVMGKDPKTGAVTGSSKEVTSALINLGFKPPQVDEVVKKLDPKMDVQEGVRWALSQLSSPL